MNNTAENAIGLSAEISVYDFNTESILKKTIPVTDLSSQEVKEVFSLPGAMNVSKTWFLDLRLFDKQHHIVSTNFYVLSTQKDSLDEKKSTWYGTPQSQYADLTLLEQLPKVKLQATETITKKEGETVIYVKLKNPAPGFAFMVYLDLKKEHSRESVVPVFWGDNYFTLLPGEERTVSVSFHTSDLEGQQPKVIV